LFFVSFTGFEVALELVDSCFVSSSTRAFPIFSSSSSGSKFGLKMLKESAAVEKIRVLN
jgi:hypothetical protein